jgi:hypothetical protein
MVRFFLLIFTVFNSFASSSFANCNYQYRHYSSGKGDDHDREKAFEVIENTMRNLGYTLAGESDSVDFMLDAESYWNTNKSETFHTRGDSSARVFIVRYSDQKTIYLKNTLARASFLNLGVGKQYSALRRLKMALRSIPNCEDAHSMPEVLESLE